MKPGRDVVVARRSSARRRADCQRRAARQRAPALHPLHLAARPESRRASLHTTGGYLVRRHADDASTSSICATTTSTGAPPTSAGSPATATSSTGRCSTARPTLMYEGAPNYSGARPLLGHHRAAPRHDPLHGADGDPRVHALGRRVPDEARSVVAAAARHRRRADQPRSVDVVPRASSAASAARSSTPGGRRRRARS